MSYKPQSDNQQNNTDLSIQSAGNDNALEDSQAQEYPPVNFVDVMQGYSFGKQDNDSNSISWLKDVSFTGPNGLDFVQNASSDLGLDNPRDFGKLDLYNPSREQMENLARAFGTTSEEVGRLLKEALTSPSTIPPEKQQAYLAAADAEIGSAMGQINVGSADAGDLGKLLSVYSNLNGFADGAIKQGAVGAMMDKIRSALAAVAAGKAVGQFDYARIIHSRETSSMVNHRAEELNRAAAMRRPEEDNRYSV